MIAHAQHTQDSDCSLDSNGLCVVCLAVHGNPCIECGGRGYHRDICTGTLGDFIATAAAETREGLARIKGRKP
jgi:hypothetical protein